MESQTNSLRRVTLMALVLFVSAFTTMVSAAHTSSSATQSRKAFIRAACNSTTYPQLCYSTLSPYASKVKNSQQKLCKVALTVAISAAKEAYKVVKSHEKLKGLGAVDKGEIKDCLDEIGDSMYEIKLSLKQISNLKKGRELVEEMEDIKTWVSAAITDENTCLDGLDERMVRAAVKKIIEDRVLRLAMLTSNALSLINGLQY